MCFHLELKRLEAFMIGPEAYDTPAKAVSMSLEVVWHSHTRGGERQLMSISKLLQTLLFFRCDLSDQK
jgi:hypothetical protein